ncbi:MAG: dihydrolipoamide acetyltransferase family protein [Pseudolysinimonas sp.]
MSARVFRLPDLGEGLTEAALVKWLVAVGDTITTDQPIAEVETAKSIVEVPSPFAGTVAALHGSEGDVLLVGAPFVEVTEAGEVTEAAADGTDGGVTDAAKDAYRAEERAGSGNVLIGYGTGEAKAGGRTRRPRGAAAAKKAPPEPPATTGPIAVRSPIVRRLAQERGVDLHAVTPTGPEGIITRADVLGAALAAPHAATPGAAPGAPGSDVVRTEPLSMLRKTVGAKMTRSRAEIPEATVWVDVDATDMWTVRQSMAADDALSGRAPSLTSMIARYVVAALEEFPVLAARLSADGTALEYLDGIHLGVAADTERGLLVPVVRNAEGMSLGQLDEAIRAMTDAARAGTAAPGQLTGSTFTLNNYGSLGVDGSAAIINHPEVAILGIGRMIERPWVVDGAIVARRITQVSLVFDHRVCDGGYASGFLRAVVDAIEHPLRRFPEL